METARHDLFIDTAGRISPELRAAIHQVGPFRPHDRRAEGLPLFLARAVIGQQLSTKVARAIWDRLTGAAERAGQVGPPALLSWLHPANTEAIRQCGVSGAKTRALITIAEAAGAGGLDAAALTALPLADRVARLCEIRGIGPWTADMASIFYFGEPDIWPAGDAAAVKTLGRHLPPECPLTIDEAAAMFAPYRSWLAMYLWRIADADPG